MKKKFGVVLGGGGARGVAHIGVLRAMEEEGLEPDCMAATSAGALVGAMYAAGCRPEEIIDFFRDYSFSRPGGFTLSKPGTLDPDEYEKTLRPYLDGLTFADLKWPLHVAATDILTASCVYFTEGELIPALNASSAVPGLFAPVALGDGYFLDGGIVNNFPVEPLLDDCEHIFGVSVNPLPKLKREQLQDTMDVLERVYHIGVRYQAQGKLERCDWSLQIEDLARFHMFKFDKVDEIFEMGYQRARKVVREIAEQMAQKP